MSYLKDKAKSAASAITHAGSNYSESQDTKAEGAYAAKAAEQKANAQMAKEARERGTKTATDLYGMSMAQTGQEVKQATDRQKALMDQNNPNSSASRNQRNSSVRALRERQGATGISGSVANQQESQIMRDMNQSITNQIFANENSLISQRLRTMGAQASSQGALSTGEAALGIAGQTNTPLASTGLMSQFSVICSELYRQGYMGDEMLYRDSAYGVWIRKNRPNVYRGYVFLAAPIVRQMRKSPLFTKIISIPTLAWANDMAYNNSFIGKCISFIGEPICDIVGRVVKRMRIA